MIKQNWNIGQDERLRILNLHESATKKLYLSEQTSVVVGTETKTENKSFPKTNLGDKFEFGKYDSETVKNLLSELKPKIEQFIKDSDSSKFIVNVSAGESQVTNPKGFEEKGSLALARANSVKKYFEELFPELIKQGTLVINGPKSVSEVTIGKTPYNRAQSQSFKQKYAKEYSQEQFVNFDITGEGSKTTTTQKTKLLCNTTPLNAKGGYLLPNNDYTQIYDKELGKGEGNVYITFETYKQPDIIYFEYNGKSYGDAVFRGSSEDEYRIFLGTSLMTKYGGGQLPPQFGNTTYERMSANDPRLTSALDEMKSWGLVKSFRNTFSANSPFKNTKYMEAFGEFDIDGRKGKLLAKLGSEFPWGIVTSNIENSVVKNLGPIPKVEGIDNIKVINVCPVGTTQWKINFNCKPVK
jgi:hypothetical protein